MGAGDQSDRPLSCSRCGRQLPADAELRDRCDEPQATHGRSSPSGEGDTADDSAAEPLSRRRVGAGILGGLVVGVGGYQFLVRNGELGHEEAEKPWSNRDIEQRARSGRLSMDLELAAGQWASVDWTPQKPVTMEYAFKNRTNNRIEMAVIPMNDLSRVSNGEEVSGFSSLYSAGVEPQAGAEMSSGDYAIIVVNSNRGEVTPEGDIAGRMRVDAALVQNGRRLRFGSIRSVRPPSKHCPYTVFAIGYGRVQ